MIFGRRRRDFKGGGLVLFGSVEEALKSEKILKGEGYPCKLVAPPPALRKGCDLSLQINLVEHVGIERALDEGDVGYIEVIPLNAQASEILDVVKTTDFGGAIMVKAGNMKLTYDKKSGVILNVSGGGCPDVPYLHLRLAGVKVTEAPRPRDIGFTLCGLMLDRALTGCLEIWQRHEGKR